MSEEKKSKTADKKEERSPESGSGNILKNFWTALGFGKKTKETGCSGKDVGTMLAHERTDLAVERTYMAADRTLMAWIRTALSMISFGFTIGKLGQALMIEGPRGMRELGTDTIAYFLVVLGTLALLAAAFQFSRTVKQLCDQGLKRRFSISLVVALVLSVVGFIAFTALVMKL